MTALANDAGIMVEENSFTRIFRNVIRDHGGSGVTITGGSAALIGDCGPAAFNGISDNGLSGIAMGQNSEATIRGNIITGNGTNGIFVTDSSMADTASNQISVNTGDGVEVRLGSSLRMGRRDPPEEGCALKPNKSTIGDNDGHGIDCGSLSTVDGLLDDLNGALGATSLNDLNEDCPDCCFTNLGLPPEMQASRRGSMPPATGYALRRDGAIADALRPFVALDQKEPRPFPHYWNETTRSDRVRAKPLDGVNPRISLPT